MTEHPKTAIDLMKRGPVIPVVVLDHAANAVPLATALLAGGVDTMEITLRTPGALEAITAVAGNVPDMAVGAGTIIRPEQARKAVDAGAAFLVSPGCGPRLLAAMLEQEIPILPGAVTASEALTLLEHGVTEMKFFPAAAAGGVPALRALAGPLPDITFCPTGESTEPPVSTTWRFPTSPVWADPGSLQAISSPHTTGMPLPSELPRPPITPRSTIRTDHFANLEQRPLEGDPLEQPRFPRRYG